MRSPREQVTWRVVFCGLTFLIGPHVTVFAQNQPAASLPRARVDVIFSSTLLAPATRNDATAAIRVWGSMLGRSRGFLIDPTVQILDDLADVRKKVLAGWTGLLALDTVDYLQLQDLPNIEPMFSAFRGEHESQQRYLLLVRRDSGINALDGLIGKNAVTHANTASNLARIWLDTTLRTAGLGAIDRCLGSIEVVRKPSAAILPVFFGKADVAVVYEADFDIAREMNPQLGAKLRVLSASPRIVDGVICLAGMNLDFRDALIAGMREMHLDPQGRQILLVFQANRLRPVDRTTLEYVRELWRKNNALAKSDVQGRPPSTASPTKLVRAGGEQ